MEHTTTAAHCYFLHDFVLSSRTEVRIVNVSVLTKLKENYSQRTFSCSLLFDLCMHCMYVSRSERALRCAAHLLHNGCRRGRRNEGRGPGDYTTTSSG